MSEFLLVRHAANDFVKTGKLAGWTPGVSLNAQGRAQAMALGNRLAKVAIDALYASPLERTVETAQAICEHHPSLELRPLEEIGEVRYGAWQGGELSKLAQQKLWRAVQINPSRVRFPQGESMREAQMRAVNALELLNERHPRSRIVIVSHSDIIKMVVAHYLGLHLDLFQRIEISPASLTVIRLSYGRPFVVQVNETSYLPMDQPPAADERVITAIRPVNRLALDAIGEPGQRVFYLQASGTLIGATESDSLTAPATPGPEDDEPVTFVLEKTQATMLAAQVDEVLQAARLTDTSTPAAPSAEQASPLISPQKLMFRVGRFTLQYSDGLVQIAIEEMPGPEADADAARRTVTLWATAPQVRALADQARAVAQKGRHASTH